jgi:transcriptional regulator with XRE-family HTH domain
MALTGNRVAIKALREAYGWRGTKFAAACGISHSHLFNVESGHKKASPELLRRMADTLGVPLAAITSDYAVEDVA